LSALWFCPPTIWFALVLWLRSSIGFAAMSGRFSAIAMLGLIAARPVQLAVRRGPARPMHATPARSTRPVHSTASAGCATRSMHATASSGPTLPSAPAFVRLS